jgi:hypothetical protein
MKQKLTIKMSVVAIIACLISLVVILSSAHAKDIVSAGALSNATSSTMYKTGDMTAKAMGDIHNHIDKQTVKSISMDQPLTARQRELKALDEEKASRSFLDMFEDMVLFYRFSFTLRLSLATL